MTVIPWTTGMSGKECEQMLRKMIAHGIIPPLSDDEIQRRAEDHRIKNYIKKMENEWSRYHGMFAVTNDPVIIQKKEDEIRTKIKSYLEKHKVMKKPIDAKFALED